MIPPRIKHIRFSRSDNREEIIEDCAKGLHMGKGEKALLKYYAKSSSGFSPALQAIANATGQNRSQVYRNRNALIDHGIIGFNDNVLLVDWSRIKIFASLDPNKTCKGIKCAPVVTDNYHIAKKVTMLDMEAEPFETLFKKLGKLSHVEYDSLCSEIKRHKYA